MKIRYFLAAAIAAVAIGAQAQQIRIASGPAGGTYSLLTDQLAKQCSKQQPSILITETKTSGSVANIDALLGNDESIKANVIFSQLDALFYKARNEDMGQLATLVNLYPEAVHVVALNKTYVVPKTGLDKAKVWQDAQTYAFSTVNDLNNGRRIGAAGGSWVTAKSIQVNGEYKFEVVKFETGDEVMAALNSEQIDAALFVGGHPLPSIAALDKKKYKLLPFNEADFKKLGLDDPAKKGGVYGRVNISYPRLDVSGMPTIYTTSALVARKTKSEAMLANYAALRSCVFAALPDLQENGHKAWKAVKDDQLTNADSQGRWPWLTLATVNAPTQPLSMSTLNNPAMPVKGKK